jgi:hypothetical protein
VRSVRRAVTASSVGSSRSIAWIRFAFIARSNAPMSNPETSETAIPVFPIRPVRPVRCRYLGDWGIGS